MLTVTTNGGTVTVAEVYNGENKLTEDTHYTVDENKVTLKSTYLDDLEEDDYTIKIETDQGDITAIITVVDTTEEG